MSEETGKASPRIEPWDEVNDASAIAYGDGVRLSFEARDCSFRKKQDIRIPKKVYWKLLCELNQLQPTQKY